MREGHTGEARDQENQAKAQSLVSYLGHVAASRQEKGAWSDATHPKQTVPKSRNYNEAPGPTPQSHSMEGISTRYQTAVSVPIKTQPL